MLPEAKSEPATATFKVTPPLLYATNLFNSKNWDGVTVYRAEARDPAVPQGEVSHTTYGFGSIVRFIEDTWKLGRLGTTDEASASIGDMLNFNQKPRGFVRI